MKKIEAIIKPFCLEALREKLLEHHFVAMTVSEIRRFPSSSPYHYDDDRFAGMTDFDPRLKVELVVADDRLGVALQVIEVCECLVSAALVTDISDAIRIRTAEHGELAV